MSNFLSMQVICEEKKISLNQHKYIQEEEYGLLNSCGRKAPLPESNEDNTAAGEVRIDPTKYQHAVGKLLYLTVLTRPDLSFACCKISQSNSNPKHKDWINVAHVLRYLNATKNLSLVYEKTGEKARAFCDSDYNATKGERVSVSGYVFILANSTFSWRTKKQTTPALSTIEAEYVSMCEAAREALWLKMIMKEMGQNHFLIDPFVIRADNQGAINLSEKGLDADRPKHIDTSYCFLHHYVNKKKLSFEYVPSAENVADLFTKNLKATKTAQFVKLLGLS